MKAVAETAPRPDGHLSADPFPSGITGPVNGPMNDGRLLPDVLHDVDFAATRPTDRRDVVSDGPESRPDSFAKGDPGPCLNFPVLGRETDLCLQAPGSDFT